MNDQGKNHKPSFYWQTDDQSGSKMGDLIFERQNFNHRKHAINLLTILNGKGIFDDFFVAKQPLPAIFALLQRSFPQQNLQNPSGIYNIQLKAFLKKQLMQVQKSQNSPKRQYSRITLKIKVTLIRMVCRKGMPFDTAIQELGLKKTTALNIIKTYKETGSIPMRKFKKTRKIKKEKPSVKIEEQSIRQPSEAQMSAEEFRNNQTTPSEDLPYYFFNFLWVDCQKAFYPYY